MNALTNTGTVEQTHGVPRLMFDIIDAQIPLDRTEVVQRTVAVTALAANGLAFARLVKGCINKKPAHGTRVDTGLLLLTASTYLVARRLAGYRRRDRVADRYHTKGA